MGGFSRDRTARPTRKTRGGLFGGGEKLKPLFKKGQGKSGLFGSVNKPITQKKARKLQRRKKNKLVREDKNRRTIQPFPPSQQDVQRDKWQTPPFDPRSRLPARF